MSSKGLPKIEPNVVQEVVNALADDLDTPRVFSALSNWCERTEADLAKLLDLCDNIMGRSFCALGDGATSPITSSIKYFREEYIAHLTQGGCPFDPVASTLFAGAGA